ncbi:YciI family protein [Maridesulfovibrio sp.]|uniref:YciI family protein n=1 Tax=Maridesulfovibrio sp. TaxID=2795000 RepID=UPI002A1873C8|nr:YciI family protein [Maridesulfovibrio sp.]
MYIVNLTYIKPLSEIDAFLEKHVEFLIRQYEKGIFIASGRKVPRNGGIILVRNIDLDELESVLSEDPFYINGVANYEVTQFIPTMMAKGLESLKDEPGC